MNFYNKKKVLPIEVPILLTVVICSLPHFLNVSAIVIFICLTMWCYLVLCLHYKFPIPGPLLRAVAGTVLFAIAFGMNEGLTLEAFISLLIFMISLKIFELKTKRDRIVTIILCYFLIVSCMFFNDSLYTFFYALFAIASTTIALITVNFSQPSLKPKMFLAGKLSLQALPFMVVLFLIFPRIQGGLWGRPPMLSSKSGFTDEITFDNISRVVRSKEVAFRVSFAGDMPDPEQRYWRGIVLSDFDGRTWKESTSKRRNTHDYNRDNTAITYTVTLEPNNHRRLFALDLPAKIDAPRTRRLNDYIWLTWRPANARLQYTAASFLEARPRAINPISDKYLELPETGNIRSKNLAAKWRSESVSAEEYFERVISYFQTNNFKYTLNPESVTSFQASDTIDSFLLDTREGFCEHYASAFAFLMRAGGVPARLVAGYLGGEVNPYGDYMVIRQSDAHVWCEVLIEDDTWLRVDPTLTVAPTRITQGMADNFVSGYVNSPLNFRIQGLSRPRWFKTISAYGDMINSRWNNYVLGYSGRDQIQLFSWIGIDLHLPGGIIQAIFFGTVLLVACGFIALVAMRRVDGKRDHVAVHWEKFCATMQKTGIPRLPYQGPMDYAQTIIHQRPDLDRSISEIAYLYAQLRYNPKHTEDTMQRFIQRVNSFSPQQQADNWQI